MGRLARGEWVRHRPTGRLGRVEMSGDALVSIAPFPPDGTGWLTAATGDFEPLRRDIRCPAAQDGPSRLGRAA